MKEHERLKISSMVIETEGGRVIRLDGSGTLLITNQTTKTDPGQPKIKGRQAQIAMSVTKETL